MDGGSGSSDRSAPDRGFAVTGERRRRDRVAGRKIRRPSQAREKGSIRFSYTVSRDLRLYLVETAEKGIDWLRLVARGRPGHGSLLHFAPSVGGRRSPRQGESDER